MAKAKETKKAMSAEEKAAKKKARQEAIKLYTTLNDETIETVNRSM